MLEQYSSGTTWRTPETLCALRGCEMEGEIETARGIKDLDILTVRDGRTIASTEASLTI